MAETSAVADPGHTSRADGMQIPLVQREIGAAEATGLALLVTRRTARRAADDRGIVGLGPLDLHNGTTQAAETRSCRQLAGIVLPHALGAGHQHSHARKNGGFRHSSQSSSPHGSLQPLMVRIRLKEGRDDIYRLGRVA